LVAKILSVDFIQLNTFFFCVKILGITIMQLIIKNRSSYLELVSLQKAFYI